MIELKRIDNKQDLQTAFAIRERVFVQEQRVPREAEYDAHEPEATHYLATCGGEPCGAARWRKTDQGVKLERFAVLPAFRNQNVGGQLLQAVLRDVRAAHPQAKVYLHAQLPAVSFYQRHGFAPEGDLFTECDIQHYKMVYQG